MAKLLIFRGEAQLNARELTDKIVRIGRGAQNDIVLEDPGKGVSRNHAEIRFEDGRYRLVDLQSQNGIWVSGERVPSVVLEPGVSAALGPFRLVVEAPAPSPAAATGPSSGIVPATEMTQLSSRPAAPLQVDTLGPPAEKPSALTPPVAKPPAPPPPVKATPAKTAPPKSAEKAAPEKKTPAPPPASSTNTRVLGLIAAAVAVIALSAFIGYKLMHRPPAVTETAAAPPPSSVPVTSSVTTTIPAPTADERLNAVEPIVIANVAADCQTALETINGVLGEDPNNERAKGLLAKANACITPSPPRGGPPLGGPTDKPAVLVAPSQGGLEVSPGETEKAYRSRMASMRKKFDEAVGLLANQKYRDAGRALDEIASEVPNGYLDLAARREEARAGVRAEGKSALTAAQAAERSGDLDVAYEQYRRAHQLDPSLVVEDATQRIAATVRDKCQRALVELAFDTRNSAAISSLNDAVKILPASDECVVKAKVRLQELKK